MSNPPTSSITLPLLREIISTNSVTTESGARIPLHSQASVETGLNLQRLIRTVNARNTLEIGLAYGISALFICEAISTLDGPRRHFAIDPCQHDEFWSGIGLLNLRRAGFDSLVDFRELPSHQAIADIEREGVKIDLAFIDGVHTFDYTMLDLFLVDRVLPIGGLIVIDDAEWQGVRKAIRYFITNRGYEAVECWGDPDPATASSAKRLRARDWAERASSMLKPLGRIARPEFAIPDRELGLIPETRCVVVRKTKEDDLRGYFGHEPF